MYEDVTDVRARMLQRMRDISAENDNTARYWETEAQQTENAPEESLRRILAKTRIVLAMLLVGAVIFLDRTGQKIGDLDSAKIFRMMELDYEQEVTEGLSRLLLSVWQAPR